MSTTNRDINRQRFTAFFFLIIFFLIAFPIIADAGSWQPLISQAGTRLASGNRQAGRVTMVQGETVIMEIVAPQLTVGSVVAVKNNALPGVPLPLQDNAALIRLTQRLGSQARGVIIDGNGNIPRGAPLFPYSYNRLYLYTNLVNPDRLPPYRDLVTELQQARIPYALKSSQELRFGAETGIRPLLIRLEGRGNQVVGQLTDFSEGTVLFSSAYNLPYQLPVAAPFGLPLQGGLAAGNQGGTAAGARSTTFTRATRVSGTGMTGRIELKGSYNRLVFADLDGNGRNELVMLNKNWLEAFQLDGDDLKPFARYRLPRKDFLPLNLHFGDFNHNGKDEIYVTLGLPVTVDEKPDTRLSSLVVELSSQKFILLGKNYPWYFRVMETRKGKRVLLAQEMGDFKQFKLPIRWAGFFDGKLKVKGEYQEGHNVFSLDNFVLDPFNDHQIIVLDMEGGLGGFNSKTQELLVSAEEDYGMYDEIVYQQKLQEIEYEGGYVIKKMAVSRFAPRRFTLKNSFGRQAFLVKKERRINPDLLEKGMSLLKDKTSKHDQVVGVQWKNSSIVETWKSPPIPRDIIDFGFTRLKGKDVMVIMTRSNTGKYALEMVK
ncbi:MAG: hypothetical protein GWP07_04030 [Xanthomonadaceae bacterium]|nr:hypothetical protein [Xanthomonadaceae bacterium]